jgi:hypothetical protein
MVKETIGKIFHHIAFTLFWGLIIALLILIILQIIQWNSQSIKTCLDRGYSEATCRGL